MQNLTNILRSIVALAMLLLSCNSYAQTIGTQEIEFTIPNSDRLVVAEVYYPAVGDLVDASIDYGVWRRKKFTKNAPVLASIHKFPLVIFSHGYQGDRFGNSWVAEQLVAAGFIVAMVDHQHNNSYEHSDDFCYGSMWQRPLDMSGLITYLLQNHEWSKYIDKNKIAAGGFSLGGLTSLWLAGIEADPVAIKDALQSYSRWNDWPNSVVNKMQKLNWDIYGKPYSDSRIKAVFSLAPALGDGFKPHGLAKVKIPTLIIVGNSDIVVPPEQNSYYYHDNIPSSELLTIKNVGHFTFLNDCSAFGKQIIPAQCTDSIFVNRTNVHKEAGDKIKEFLLKNL
jgi:predicted dienelactone hydrolase